MCGPTLQLIMFHMIGACGASVLCAAAFRLAAVLSASDKLKSKGAVLAMVVAHSVIVFPIYIAASLVVPVVIDRQKTYAKLANVRGNLFATMGAHRPVSVRGLCVTVLRTASEYRVYS